MFKYNIAKKKKLEGNHRNYVEDMKWIEWCEMLKVAATECKHITCIILNKCSTRIYVGCRAIAAP
jgi:hypothetical protein